MGQIQMKKTISADYIIIRSVVFIVHVIITIILSILYLNRRNKLLYELNGFIYNISTILVNLCKIVL